MNEKHTNSQQEVSPIHVVAGLFDQNIQGTLGLTVIKGTHTMLYQAAAESYKFCHHPNLGIFKGRLYAMWSNGIEGEDQNGQRILYCHTTDGVTWSEPTVLAEPFNSIAGPMNCVAAGFHNAGNTLVAYNSSVIHERPVHPDNALYARTSLDGSIWSKPPKIADGFFIENPRQLPSGRLLMNGQWANCQPRLMYTDSADGISGWKDASIPAVDVFQGGFPEPNWFLRPDGNIIMLFRTKGGIPWLYASTSSDDGKSWTKPVATNFPDCTARSAVGNLPDGTAFVINNPSQNFGRIPLTIALSKDCATFDRAFVIRSEPTEPRFKGHAKSRGWQYPSALVWKNRFFVVYSINKEDVAITRIALKDLIEQ